ncbi:MAG: phosphopyruvate hydratase [Gammaproteobacteria bacterium]|nr:phosphopyruvate hydratase [Gammaproteobacteria bacterium]
MAKIKHIIGREILDSRGNPTLEADVILDNDMLARASVPSGASTGQYEAVEYRDHDMHRYAGKGVLKAVHHINTLIAPALIGQAVDQQDHIDAMLCELDGTPNKSHLGANALLAVSLATARAHALASNRPLFLSLNTGEPMCLPVPLMNIINGGAHADNQVDIQEFMIVPIGAESFPHALQMGAEIFHTLKSILKQQGLTTAVGDEGGFAPSLESNHQALDLIGEAVIKAGYALNKDIVFALDVAASELFNGTHYELASKPLSADMLIDYYQTLIHQYPIKSIEDGLDQSDWEGWKTLTQRLGQHVQLVGDDLFVTHTHLLEKGIQQHTANAILIKPNQVGTLTETMQAIHLAQAHGYETVMSHRSGETEDTFIADLAVATGCHQIKTGSLCRTDRIAKYNQLLRIHELSALPYATKNKNMRIMS